MTTTEKFMTDMTNALIDDAIDHAEEIGRSIPDEDTAPDPAFDGMAIPVIWEILDEIAYEEWAWFQERGY